MSRLLRPSVVSRLLFFVLCGEVAIYLVLSAPAGSSTAPADRAGPTQSPAGERPSGPGRLTPAGQQSLFSGDFWEAGTDPDAPPEVLTEPGPVAENTEILEPVSPGNPRNPATGAPFTDRQMARFDEVNGRFPGNTIVPRRRADVRRIMEAESKIVTLERQAQRGAASPEQIDQVYRYYVERENANIRLLEYLKGFAETKEQKARHRWLQERAQRSLERRRQQRARLLERHERIQEERE